jgi:CrcB protein
MRSALFVFIGGGVGSVLRYWLSYLIPSVSGFPVPTFLVNVVGCFLIGWLMAQLSTAADNTVNSILPFLLVSGFCGGFTTFSTFSLENIKLLQQQQIGLSLLYISLSLIACLLATGLGYAILKFR